MGKFVEGQTYVTTEIVSMRPHGYVPEGTVVRVVEIVNRDQVYFEFVHGVPDELDDKRNEWAPASPILSTLVPHVERAPSRVRAWASMYGSPAAIGLLCLIGASEYFGLPANAARAWRGYPVAYQHLSLSKDHIHGDEDIVLHVDQMHSRACLWTWTNVWSRVNDDKTTQIIVITSHTAQQVSEPGIADNIDIPIPTPRKLRPGTYTIQSKGTAECDFHDTYTDVVEPLTFYVDDAANTQKTTGELPWWLQGYPLKHT